jgi:peptidoglycan hydrolase CwlO-like protein
MKLSKLQQTFLGVVVVLTANIVPPVLTFNWFDYQTSNLKKEVKDLKDQWAQLQTKDERVRELETELIQKRGEIDKIYEDVDKVYVKWNDAEQEIMEMKAKFRNCKVE